MDDFSLPREDRATSQTLRVTQMAAVRFSHTPLKRPAIKYGGLLAEDLKALTGTLDYEDPAFIIHLYCDRPIKPLLPFLQTPGHIPTLHQQWVQLHTLPAPLR